MAKTRKVRAKLVPMALGMIYAIEEVER